MKRLILLALSRGFETRFYSAFVVETEKGVLVRNLWESGARSYLKSFCQRQNLEYEWFHGDTYQIFFKTILHKLLN